MNQGRSSFVLAEGEHASSYGSLLELWPDLLASLTRLEQQEMGLVGTPLLRISYSGAGQSFNLRLSRVRRGQFSCRLQVIPAHLSRSCYLDQTDLRRAAPALLRDTLAQLDYEEVP